MISKLIQSFIFLLFLHLIETAEAQTSDNTRAILLLKAAVMAMGKGWDTVKTLQLQGYGNGNIIDQSERWEGPYIPSQVFKKITIDIPDKMAMVELQETQSVFNSNNGFIINEYGIASKYPNFKSSPPNDYIQDHLLLSPEFLLSNAWRARKTVLYQKDTSLQKAKCYVLKFYYHGFPIRIFINSETSCLTAAETIKPYECGYATIWGDCRKLVYYSYWVLLGKNIHFPAQTDIYLNNYKLESFLITDWKVNRPLLKDSLIIPDSILQKSRLAYSNSLNSYVQTINAKAKEIAKNIWILPGPVNSTIVKQDEGLIIIESPFSSDFGEAVLKKAREIFPSQPIKAFIATSDAWLHLGGIRPMALLSIPVYYPYRNDALIRNILRANYTTYPDSLQKSGKWHCSLKAIKDVTTIGKGINRIVLYPYKTETGDRMMMVYFPTNRILYGSDLFQPKKKSGEYWFPHYSWEVYSSIKSYHIKALKLYGMHVKDLVEVPDLEKDFMD